MRLAQRQRTVNFNVQEINGEAYRYRWQSVTLEPGIWHYDPIVSAIVQLEYPTDRMQAVVNNYLADPGDEAAATEMQDMQDWRRFAKEVAHGALDYVKL